MIEEFRPTPDFRLRVDKRTRQLRRHRRQRIAALAAVVASLAIALSLALPGGAGRSSVKFSTPSTPTSAPYRSAAGAAVWVADQLAGGRFTAMADQIDPSDPFRPPAQILRSEWDAVQRAYGPLKGVGSPLVVQGDDAQVQLTMVRGVLLLQVNLTAGGRLGGLGLQVAAPEGQAAISTAGLVSRADILAQEFVAGNLRAAVATLDPLLQIQNAASWVPTQWQQFLHAFGPVLSVGQPTALSIGTYGTVVNVPITSNDGLAYLQFQFDPLGQVAMAVELPPGTSSSSLVGISVQPTSSDAQLASGVAHDIATDAEQSAVKQMAPIGAKNSTSTSLRHQWSVITQPLGRLEQATAADLIAGSPAAEIYEIGYTFQHGSAHIQVGIDSTGHITSINILPGPPTWTINK